jgi:hypothetical protein
MDFFDQEARARKQTRRLIWLFGLAALVTVRRICQPTTDPALTQVKGNTKAREPRLVVPVAIAFNLWLSFAHAFKGLLRSAQRD